MESNGPICAAGALAETVTEKCGVDAIRAIAVSKKVQLGMLLKHRHVDNDHSSAAV